jgi:hypothetical protein
MARGHVIVGVLCVTAGLIAGCGSASTVTQTVTQSGSSPSPGASTTPATSSGGGGKTVPADLIGERLDVAESELDGQGISYTEIGGGAFGIVVKSNWIVCQTKPVRGQRVSGSVDLIVQHYNCSGG